MIDYMVAMSSWLSGNYKRVAFDIYSKFGSKEAYKSKFLRSIVDDEDKLLVSPEDDKNIELRERAKKKTISNIRLRLHKKIKYNTKFTLDELQDFCSISNKTPNDILEIEKDTIKTLILLSKEEIAAIRENFEKLSKDNITLKLICFAFPLLGVFCEVNFKNNSKVMEFSIKNLTARKDEEHISISFRMRNILTNEQSEYETYDELLCVFQNTVKDLTYAFNLSAFKCIKSLSSSISSFYNNELFEEEIEEMKEKSELENLIYDASSVKDNKNSFSGKSESQIY